MIESDVTYFSGIKYWHTLPFSIKVRRTHAPVFSYLVPQISLCNSICYLTHLFIPLSAFLAAEMNREECVPSPTAAWLFCVTNIVALLLWACFVCNMPFKRALWDDHSMLLLERKNRVRKLGRTNYNGPASSRQWSCKIGFTPTKISFCFSHPGRWSQLQESFFKYLSILATWNHVLIFATVITVQNLQK